MPSLTTTLKNNINPRSSKNWIMNLFAGFLCQVTLRSICLLINRTPSNKKMAKKNPMPIVPTVEFRVTPKKEKNTPIRTNTEIARMGTVIHLHQCLSFTDFMSCLFICLKLNMPAQLSVKTNYNSRIIPIDGVTFPPELLNSFVLNRLGSPGRSCKFPLPSRSGIKIGGILY